MIQAKKKREYIVFQLYTMHWRILKSKNDLKGFPLFVFSLFIYSLHTIALISMKIYCYNRVFFRQHFIITHIHFKLHQVIQPRILQVTKHTAVYHRVDIGENYFVN